MNKVIIVIDAQVDFTTGRLGSEQAAKVSRKLQDFVREHRKDYAVTLATLDTHRPSETDTVEARTVPPHCIQALPGHALVGDLAEHVDMTVMKSAFMAGEHAIDCRLGYAKENIIDVIDVCGFCTDICVVSNALMLRRNYPKAKIRVIEDLCAGTTEAKHQAALDVMRSCLIEVVSSEDVAKETPDDTVPAEA